MSHNHDSITFDRLLKLSCDISSQTLNQLRKWNIHYKLDKPSGRLLLTADRHKANHDIAAIRKCNGLILHNGNVLVQPQEMLNAHARLDDVIANWSRYTQYAIIDGSVISLYYFDGWCLSTTNGYKVNDYGWDGSDDTTYMDVLLEALSVHNLSLDDLDTTLNYTFIIRDSRHLFTADKNGIWLLQVCNGSTNITLPHLPQIPRQTARNNLSYKHANEIAQGSLDNYLRCGKIQYGFILRANNLGRDSNILLEGTLLRKIRQFIYNLPKGKNRPDRPRSYCVLRAYLNYSTGSLFKKLFPQFIPTYAQLDKLFTDVTNKVMNCMRNRNLRAALIETHTDTVSAIAYKLMSDIDRMENVNTFDSTSVSILRDIIIDKKYLDDYYKIIYQ
jgi:hypothetical protein